MAKYPSEQRTGAWLFGLADIGFGFCFVSLAKQDDENGWVWWALAAAIIALGVLMCYNGSRRAVAAEIGSDYITENDVPCGGTIHRQENYAEDLLTHREYERNLWRKWAY